MSILPAANDISAAQAQDAEKLKLEAFLAGLKEVIGGAGETAVTLSYDAFTYPVGSGCFVVTSQTGSADNLKWITTTADTRDGQTALVRAASGHTITVYTGGTGAGQILTRSGSNMILADSKHFVLLKYKAPSTSWEELVNSVDLQAVLANPGGQAQSTLTIASGAVIPNRFLHLVDTESAAATDDLDFLTQTYTHDGSLACLSCVSASRVVTLRHNQTGGGKLVLTSGVNAVLDNTSKSVWLFQSGATWVEIARFGFVHTVAEGGTNNGALSVAAGSIAYADGSKLVGLAPPPSNKALTYNTSSNAPEWTDSAAPYTSADTTIANGQLYDFTHALGAAPGNVSTWLVCQSTDGGYAANDVVRSVDYVSYAMGLAVYADATKVYVRIGSNGLYGFDKGTGGATALTTNKWKLRVIARK